MSRENVEIVRQAFEAESRRDATVLALFDRDVEMDFSASPFADFAKRGRYEAIENMRNVFRDWYEAMNAVESDVVELIDAGDQVISVFTYRGRGRTSGVEVEWKHMAGVWTFDAGKIVQVTWLRSREEALEAVGLRK